MRFQFAIAPLAALMFAGAAFAQQQGQAPASRFRLYPSAAADSAAGPLLTVVVPPNGVVPLTLVPPPGTSTVDLVLSSFSDPRGILAEVRIALAGESPGMASAARRDVRLDGALVGVRLEVGQLPTPDPFAGFLFITQGNAVLQTYKLSLRRPGNASPAKLVLDRQTIALSYTRPMLVLGPHRGPRFTVIAREETGDRQLEGVTLRLMEIQSPNSAFDPQHDLTLVVNGDTLAHPWTLPAKDPTEGSARRIPPGGQMAIEGLFSGLRAGEHRVKLRITAANSQEDPRQELTLTLKVRDSIGWAVLALFLSIAFSYLTTKYLNIRRQRVAFERRLADQFPHWLRDEPPILGVVWVRAIVKQAQDLSQRWLLAGTEVLDARIGQASELVGRLEALRRIRTSIEGLQQDPLVVRRAWKALGAVEARLGAGPLDPQLASRIDADLTQLQGWSESDPEQLEKHYWNHLRGDVEALLASVDPKECRDGEVRKLVEKLVGELRALDPPDLQGKLTCERLYCKLKLLWERHGKAGLEDELTKLLQLNASDEPLESFFAAADRAAWMRLCRAVEDGKLKFVSPRQESPEALEAYDPLLFRIAPEVAGLGDNYLFKHGIQYEWRLKLQPTRHRLKRPRHWFKEPAPIERNPVGKEPLVIHYAVADGALSAEVTLSYEGESRTVRGPGWFVGESTDFTWMKAFESVELTAVILASIVALVTGLSILYVDNATFGSLKDYISVFLWGAGVDQTKNFLQTLQSYSGSPGAAVARVST